MIVEQENLEHVDWHEVADLFAAVGWGRPEPAELAAAFAKSSHVVFVFEDRELVGVGRTIGDGRYYASIVDVAVKPEFQKRGIGTRIVTNLQGRLSGYTILTITAADDVRPFYARLGWKHQRTAMMLPRDLRQEQANCFPEDPDPSGDLKR
jgi:aralkylamine N-acetyltransferase